MPCIRPFAHLLTFGLVLASAFSTLWLYALYPRLHGCHFPTPPSTLSDGRQNAPFRLLALGDPQLEGDSSLPQRRSSARTIFETQPEDRSSASGDAEEGSQQPEHERRGLSWVPIWLVRVVRDVLIDGFLHGLQTCRKRVDLWGNDCYLAHIYHTIARHARPTHVTVLGDLLGSQWISDQEFARRVDRFWGRVFRGLERVPQEIMDAGGADDSAGSGGHESNSAQNGPWFEALGADAGWRSRLISVAGNHDIGYAGDVNEERLERYEHAFGRANWEVWFTSKMDAGASRQKHINLSLEDGRESDKPSKDTTSPPALRLIILNSMNLDTVALSPSLQTATYDFINAAVERSRPVTDKTVATILLTHVPLHKPQGVCVDAPFFSFYPDGRVREQNHLSPHASRAVLESLFGLSSDEQAQGGGLGRKGVVLSGHDHEGCDVLHYVLQDVKKEKIQASEEREAKDEGKSAFDGSEEDEEPAPETNHPWLAFRLPSAPSTRYPSLPNPSPDVKWSATPHLREITLRSMMGSYSGYAGLLSAWFDDSVGESGEWQVEFATCALGVQHWWWAIHILNIVAAGALMYWAGRAVWVSCRGGTGETEKLSRAEDRRRGSDCAKPRDEKGEKSATKGSGQAPQDVDVASATL